MAFNVNIEPTSWHSWVKLPDGKIIDWNAGLPTKLQVSTHDSFSKTKLKSPFEPVYEEVTDPLVLETLQAQQKDAVTQWVAYSLKTWPFETFVETWQAQENQCLINSFIASKKNVGRIMFGKFGWKRNDGSVYFEYDGKSPEEMMADILEMFRDHS